MFALGLGFRAGADEGGAPISVADLLRFATVGDPQTLDWNEDFGAPGTFSPDGSKVAVIVSGGDAERETNNASLWVYATANLLGGELKPTKLAEFASATSYRPIAFAHWLADNENLVFAGAREAETPQIFRVNSRTRNLEPLTRVSGTLLWYDVALSGNRLVTFVEPSPTAPKDEPQCRRYGCRVESTYLYDAERGGDPPAVGVIYNLLTSETKPLIQPEIQNRDLSSCDAALSGGISPDGRYAIRLCTLNAKSLPAWWGDYAMDPAFHECIVFGNVRCFRRGFVVDLETGQSRAWTDAPLWHPAYVAPPVWIDGGRHVILPTAFESLKGVDAKERARRARSYVVQLLDPATRKLTRIGWLDSKVARFTRVSWDEASQILMVQGEDSRRAPVAPAYFERKGTRWEPRTAPASVGTHTRVKLELEQSLNDRPLLVATDIETGRRRTVLDPNPWLADRKSGHVEALSWKTRIGETWHGGLYYPPGYQVGKRYPLLIQTHGFEAHLFSLNGWAKSFPGQALAAHGMVVLQIDEDRRESNGADTEYSPEYWKSMQAGQEGVIDQLDEMGLIDRQHVGTIGFSATGPTTAYLFTHSEYPIAAAAFGDTGGDGWWSYLSYGGSQKPDPHFGTQPFSEGIAPWLELSPLFNLARVRTPLLMFEAESPLGTWDWYAGLRSLHKPVEFWSLPTGTHDVYQASQRLRMNQLTVDWFRFWLKDEERRVRGAYQGETAEALADQYVRWRALRAMHESDMKKPRPPLLKWSATPRETGESR